MAAEPASARRSHDLAIMGAILLAACAAWIVFRLHTGIRLEDALITYRYARNLAEGNGFVFNPGEPVLGTTTPLLALLLGLAGALFGAERIPLASDALMMGGAAGAGALTCLALRELGLPRGLSHVTMAALLFHPEMLWMICGGMETPLVLLFMAAGLWGLARGSHGVAAGASALLVLTRIDGSVWAMGVLGAILLRDRAAFRKGAILFGVILAPWVIFALLYFGSPIPHSVIAKRVIGSPHAILSLPHLLERAAWNTPFFAWPAPFLRPLGWLLFAAGAFALLRRPAAAAHKLLVVHPVLFSLSLWLGRSPLYFDWYLAPAGYAALLVGAFGVGLLGRRLAGWRDRGRLARRAAGGVALAAYFVLMGLQAGRTAAFHRDYQINEEGTRRAVGEWLDRNTPREAVVAMEAVGYQAYYARRKVIDLAGLISPRVVAIRRQSWSNAAGFHRVLEDLKPDYLVLRSFEVDRNLHYHGGRLFETPEQMAYFARGYDEVKRFEAPLPRVWGETSHLTIYRRRAD